MERWKIAGFWILVGALFFIKGVVGLDPDVGWHVRLGEIIAASGIPATDPFSYTMPDYPFVDHEWLTNVGMAVVYKLSGMAGLAAAFAGFSTLALVIALRGWRGTETVIWGLLAASALWTRAGTRPQVITWLFLAMTWQLLERHTWVRWRWTFPVLMAVWANLHGGFAVGVVVVGVVLGVRWWRERHWHDAVVWAMGVGATFINPYWWRIWWEVGMQMSDPLLRRWIVEWQPAYASPGLGEWAIVAGVVGLGMRYWRKIEVERWMVWGGLAAAGLASLRHGGLAVVAGLPMVSGLMRVADWELRGERWEKFKKLLVGVAAVAAVVEIGGGWIRYRQLREERYYPKKAVAWLEGENLEGNIFASYNWGGYLIWRMRDKKVFVDGRMPSWREGEYWAFREYLMAAYNEKDEYREIFAKYGVRAVLWPKKNGGSLVGRLEAGGWKKGYEDQVAVIMTQ